MTQKNTTKMRFFLTLFVAASTAWVWPAPQSASSGLSSQQAGMWPAPASSSTAPSLTSINVTPANTTQIVGSAVAFTATGNYSDGSTQNLTTTVTWASGNSAIASLGSLTTTQSVNCVSPGGTTISATLSSISGTTTLICAGPQAVSLPTAWANTHECDATLTAPNQTINFPASGTGGAWAGGQSYTANSQSSLNQAIADAENYRDAHQNAGAVKISIPAGAVFSGATTIILSQSAGDASTSCIALVTTGSLPAGQTVCAHGIQDNNPESTDVGSRNQACTNDVAQMFTLETTTANVPAIKTGPADANGVGPHHYLIIGMEARELAGSANTITYLAAIGSNQLNETSVGQLASHIYIDRSWFHGDWTDGGAGANNISHMLLMDCFICGVTNSQWSMSENGGFQNQAISIIQSQTVKIVHNWFDGPGQNVICGGAAMTITTGIQSCNDLEFRRNLLSYPPAWLGSTFKPHGQSPNRIAALEFKSCNRCLVDGNILENVDDSGAQNRPFGLNPKAYNNASPQYFINVSNVTWTNNVHRNVCNSGAMLATRSAIPPNGNGVSMAAQNFLFQNDLWYNADKPSFCNAGDVTGNGAQIGASDTFFTGCTAQRDNLGQTTTLTCINSGVGTAQTDTNVGDPVLVTGCSDTTFNVGGSTLGPPALAGTNPNGLTIVYSNPGTANAPASGCTFDNFQGFPKNLTFAHNTLIFASGSQGLYVALAHGGLGGGTVFAQNNTITDNIILGNGVGGQGLSDSSNPTSQAANWDLNTTVWHHDLYVTRSCTKYVDLLTLGGSQINPPTTSFCPSTSYCTGNDPTVGSCVGFNGLMSASSLNNNLADWHGYRLCHSGDASCANPSLYAAGQADPASDGTDRGANFSSIDNAETQTEYTCSSACGNGPFPD